MRGWLMKSVLVLVGATLLGGLASGFVVAISPTVYEADAYVALTPMPPEVRAELGTDLAGAIDGLYQAGPLQDAVLADVTSHVEGWTAQDVRQHTQVAPLSFTPLTKIAVRSSKPGDAITLANTIAQSWVDTVTSAYDTAFATRSSALSAQDDTLSQEIATTEQAITAGTTHCGVRATITRPACATADQLAALQATLSADLKEQSDVREQMTMLDVRHAQIVRIAYVGVQADGDTTSVQPDVAKTVELGVGGGLAAGALLALWVLREPMRRVGMGMGRGRRERGHVAA